MPLSTFIDTACNKKRVRRSATISWSTIPPLSSSLHAPVLLVGRNVQACQATVCHRARRIHFHHKMTSLPSNRLRLVWASELPRSLFLLKWLTFFSRLSSLLCPPEETQRDAPKGACRQCRGAQRLEASANWLNGDFQFPERRKKSLARAIQTT